MTPDDDIRHSASRTRKGTIRDQYEPRKDRVNERSGWQDLIKYDGQASATGCSSVRFQLARTKLQVASNGGPLSTGVLPNDSAIP
jgi:hypothetical protein